MNSISNNVSFQIYNNEKRIYESNFKLVIYGNF